MNSSSTPKLVVGDTEVVVNIDSENITIGSELLFKHTNLSFLGSIVEDSEDTEVVVNGVNVGSNDCEILSTYGVVIDKDEDSDEFKIIVPKEQIETHLIIE